MHKIRKNIRKQYAKYAIKYAKYAKHAKIRK